jgi:hypothetical protein
MFYFALGILSVFAFILLSRKWPWVWRVVASVLVWAIGFGLLYFFTPSFRVLGPVGGSPYLADIVLFVVLILGMSAKYLWDLIEIRSDRNSKRSPGQPTVGLGFDFWDFVKPMLVSVIVFGAVMNEKHELTRIAVLASFQNGFFWQTVFKKKVSETVRPASLPNVETPGLASPSV